MKKEKTTRIATTAFVNFEQALEGTMAKLIRLLTAEVVLESEIDIKTIKEVLVATKTIISLSWNLGRQTKVKKVSIGVSTSIIKTSMYFLRLPKDCIPELTEMRRQLILSHKNWLYVNLRMIQEIFELVWAFHIQIRIENLWLPKNENTKKVDD